MKPQKAHPLFLISHPGESVSFEAIERGLSMSVRTIDISIRFPPSHSPDRLVRAARQAEDVGFSTIWMVDTPLIAGELFDPYVDLAVCALNTERVQIGPAVSTFALRHPIATGAAILGLDRISGQRAILGLGTGGSALITLGQMTGHQGAFVAQSTVERRKLLRDGVLLLKQLFAGEPVNLGTREIRLPQPRNVPIYIAATGPKALELAGEIADGVIMQVGIHPVALKDAIAAIRRGADRAGRDFSAIRLICSTFAVVSDDRSADIDRVRPIASFFYSVTPGTLKRLGYSIEKRFPDWVPAPDLTHAYDWDDAMAAAATYIPDEVVTDFCLVGPPEEALSRICQLADLGVHEVFLRWWSTYELPNSLVAAFGLDIIPHIRR